MRKSVLGRLALGLLAFSPLLVAALVLAIVFGFRSSTVPLGRIVIVTAVISIVLYAAAVAYFLYLVQTESRFDSADKARWTLVLMMWFPFGAISFWYQFVWRNGPLE